VDSVAAAVIGDVTLVIAVSALLSAVARRCRQPAVIGQMLTGIVLGPSLLGRLPGHLTVYLFPHQVLPYLAVLAQIAVVLFMFVVGYEIELGAIRGRGLTVPLVATSALAVPFALGMGCVILFRSDFTAVGEAHQDRSFLLFMGVTCSITALPVLAAIVRERGLAGTRAGTTATLAAGTMDVLAWLALAVALIGSGHSARFSWWVTLFLISCFVAAMLFVIAPLLSWWMGRSKSILSNPAPVAFALAMGSAWVTASLGLQAVFGGFLAGLAMHAANRERDADLLRFMDQAGGLLLPLFFVVTGLSLNIGAMHGDAFVLLAAIFVVAVAGKLGPAYAVSRACGLRSRESATVAALVNTRGLTELIALNVGLAAGLISQRLFTVLVVMALITTVLTGPLLSLVNRFPGTPEGPTVAESLASRRPPA
jgi:Kef-type K+ transport system membrane component KefB